ncbi:MAG TPA: hypothetical protein VLC74_03005 [Rhizomicrobium sp.]|nr:hypothetical protein [Rhizomicrobium sp.]
MKYSLAALAASIALAVAPAMAQDQNAPSFENGVVLDVASIQTKDGHFNDYMHWLATDWKRQEEALKKAGVIVDYHVWLVQNQRAGEPDIMLTQTYKNMAVFDASQAEQYALQARIAGSIAKSDQGQAARGSIRTIMGDMMVREAVLR